VIVRRWVKFIRSDGTFVWTVASLFLVAIIALIIGESVASVAFGFTIALSLTLVASLVRHHKSLQARRVVVISKATTQSRPEVSTVSKLAEPIIVQLRAGKFRFGLLVNEGALGSERWKLTVRRRLSGRLGVRFSGLTSPELERILVAERHVLLVPDPGEVIWRQIY
jgi:hypothetical protein